MTKLEIFREIAADYADLADEVGKYWRRLKQQGASMTTIEALAADEISLRNLSALNSERAAELATKLTLAELESVEKATKEAKEFLKELKKIQKGVKLIRGLVGLGLAVGSGNFGSASDSFKMILEALEKEE